eukprot:CAMPEP_0178455152 /NCGR_PEP_ID=MMETSP0689_2-20121128/45751_1 /TAXON_ID=160604 /ORGANISM="Amphidinium massartii, Strain CS-259" /LENGTH=60 /DNA_ID=CAMNT_0020081157 /DNA_START=115 /DNA_END=297 /DNA_ORIENTATION=+
MNGRLMGLITGTATPASTSASSADVTLAAVVASESAAAGCGADDESAPSETESCVVKFNW